MAIHSHILHNGRICDASSAELRAGQLGLLAGWGVFSTLRISGGVPFAWERHWARMSRDARLLNLPMPADPDVIERDLLRLIETNGQPDCTLRIVLVRNTGGMWEGPGESKNPVDILALTANSKKWGSSVSLGVVENARFAGNEFVSAKIISWAQNLTWAETAIRNGYDEVVLLNQGAFVTECTSANIFVSFGDLVLTPPTSDGCLPGITREVLLEEIRVPGVRIEERSLTVEDLNRADEVFITSTTRDLLPVRELQGRKLSQAGRARTMLSSAFSKFLESDLAARRVALTTA